MRPARKGVGDELAARSARTSQAKQVVEFALRHTFAPRQAFFGEHRANRHFGRGLVREARRGECVVKALRGTRLASLTQQHTFD